MSAIMKDFADGIVKSMESEIPEVVVFFSANDQCQLFKDVGVDGEVPCHDKCCVQDCELDHDNISNLLKYELAKTSTDVTEEVVFYISTGVGESFSNHHCLQEDVKNKLMEDKAGFGGKADIANVHPLKGESFRSQNVATDSQINKFPIFQLLKATDDLEDAKQNHQEQIRDAIPAESLSSGKEGVADEGSSSFSAASTSSGRLTFSGSVLNSDNILIRSNSTTSSTSFAFPILATAWNESPVRMAENDKRRRRRSKKCTCWRICFSCSNF